MSHDAFMKFFAEVFGLYTNGQYVQAQDYLEQHGSAFPEAGSQLMNIRMCLLALQGKNPQATVVLQEALECGCYWPAEMLRSDPDLASLQGQAEFEELVERSERHYQTARIASRPDMLVYPPISPDGSSDGEPPLLIALHGRGSSAIFNAEYWSELRQHGWRMALPQSSQLLWSDAWGWDDTELAYQEVKQHYRALQKQAPIDPEQTVLAGFSQGGGLAIRLALLQRLPVRRWIAVAPFLPDVDQLRQALAAVPRVEQRGYIMIGEDDHLAGSLPDLLAVLEERQVRLHVERFAGLGHMYPENFPNELEKAIKFIFS